MILIIILNSYCKWVAIRRTSTNVLQYKCTIVHQYYSTLVLPKNAVHYHVPCTLGAGRVLSVIVCNGQNPLAVSLAGPGRGALIHSQFVNCPRGFILKGLGLKPCRQKGSG